MEIRKVDGPAPIAANPDRLNRATASSPTPVSRNDRPLPRRETIRPPITEVSIIPATCGSSIAPASAGSIPSTNWK